MSAKIESFKREWAEAAAKDVWRANAVQATSITPTAIHWAWPGWLALGKLTILAGAGGTGKTTLTIGLAATMTCGGRWPDGEIYRERRSVIIWSSEDDAADTIVPRLIASGADLSKVYILQGRVNGLGEVEPFDPAKDIDLLAAELERIGDVGLIMIDPIVSAVAGDMHRANDVRRALQGLVDLAERYDCAVLGITHFSKGSAGSNPAERVLGSQAFGALARTVLVAAKQEDSDLRVLARAKSNIADDSGGCSYSIEECTVRENITTTRVLWGERIEGSAREILADVERVEGDEQPDGDDPSDCLYRILKDNPLESNNAKSLMKSNGYTEKQIRRAREKLAVVVARTGSKKDVKSYWSLPQETDETLLVPSKPYSCPSLGVGTSEKKGHELEKGARVDAAEDFDEADAEVF
ncbi:AAA domain-containing protein [Geopseudomonas sagittaria]|uniref:AAA domain-containing protein n=1 Tax=Geopseudomonas sagittaria TaxID=1135990 RepID=A0A1I5P0M6_9GAMM|nr:AAA family ATPase [Pseudomonas sagittaria]MCM2329826.1 AAA family ATPase [Pseudomonas sagittaria]SFP27582.1 AAA domain-containing protein [Pseudomonas sagittaria]